MTTNKPTATDARELDREIAERLGWTHIEPFTYWEESYDTGPYEVHGFRGIDPTGSERLLPNWQSDMNAVMTLVEHAQPAYFTLSYSPDRMNWRAEFAFGYRKDIFADALEPTHAIVLAWVDWLASQRTYTAAAPEGGE